ncbi:MAG: UDP-N-acetylmuramate dehydrogenase [Myxococcales bacterium]|nr:UDP-N-acetylmuramate dehydrogenase [Myxococcales bacterium]
MNTLAPPLNLRLDEPLAPRTTLGVGGRAAAFVEARTVNELRSALRFAADGSQRIVFLGGGSNVIVPDAGFDGLVIQPRIGGLQFSADGRVRVGAGVPWDAFVDAAVEHRLQGLECLTGIPGLAGAAPIQNIGAYGQELADTLVEVEVLDLETMAIRRLPAVDCAFAYRTSRFKTTPGAFVVLGFELQLRKDAPPCRAYAEVAAATTSDANLSEVVAAVRALRRSKAMLLDEEVKAGPDGQSAGSFFVNPIVSETTASGLPASVPRYGQPDGQVKLSAASLIERAGFPKGTTRGSVGSSTRHALALVNRGGATASEVLAYAAEIQSAVRLVFGVELTREPVLLGQTGPEPTP